MSHSFKHSYFYTQSADVIIFTSHGFVPTRRQIFIKSDGTARTQHNDSGLSTTTWRPQMGASVQLNTTAVLASDNHYILTATHKNTGCGCEGKG
jgi:hypothetical protein